MQNDGPRSPTSRHQGPPGPAPTPRLDGRNAFASPERRLDTRPASGPRADIHRYNEALFEANLTINQALDQHKFVKHSGRIVTVIGSLAALGGGAALAAGVVSGGVLGALGLPTAGLSLPPAAIAAIAGVGAAALGLGIAAGAGALTRMVARRTLLKDPIVLQKVDALRGLRSALLAKNSLSSGEKALLKNVSQVLAKVDGGFRHNLRTQAKVAGKTTGLAALGVFFAAWMVAVAESPMGFLADGSTYNQHGVAGRSRLRTEDGPIELGLSGEALRQSLISGG